MIEFETSPERYRHWRLAVDGRVATLALAVDEEGGLFPGYKLKLNSYDLGVDIELNDALNRIRFEHPAVGAVVITSARERMFCAGANIYMLGLASHGAKVNFCRFTNETRNGIEDSSRHSGLKFLAALNGTAAGGGYELALACDEIALIDDRSSTVSLPEVPLLGVLPGTGGLTRLVDKRRIRRDLADLFCTSADGVRAGRAKEWGFIDLAVPPQRFAATIAARAAALAAASDRPTEARGVPLAPLAPRITAEAYRYTHVAAALDRDARVASLTVNGPAGDQPQDLAGIKALGARWWPLAMARELDDAILRLRANEPAIGTLLLKTAGEIDAVLGSDRLMLAHRDDWFVRECLGFLRRSLARLEVTARSLFAVIERGSCFAGTLLELALAADRAYMLAPLEADETAPRLALSAANFGGLATVGDTTRLGTRFHRDEETLAMLGTRKGEALDGAAALTLGLVTATPDELDWEDEIRLAIEERASLSPDALTGLEANLRFAGPETLATKIFGRLSAWQNWIFTRPNATGEGGALKRFGSGAKPSFDWERS